MRPHVGVLVIGAVLLVAGGAAEAYGQERDDPRRPVRNGFTLEVGLGAGYTEVIPDEGNVERKPGISGLSLSLGAFLNPDWAILFRMTGTSYFADVEGQTTEVDGGWHRHEDKNAQLASGVYALTVQNWLSDSFFWSVGVGFALWGANELTSDVELEPEQGWGGTVRAGYSFANWENHSLRFSLEVTPARYADTTIVGAGLNFGWQYF